MLKSETSQRKKGLFPAQRELLKITMELENGPLEKDILHLQTIHFEVSS